MKKTIAGICCVLVCIILFLCISNQTTEFQGEVTRGEITKSADIVVKTKKIDRLLGYRRISGSVSLQIDGDETTIEYEFAKPVFRQNKDCYWVTINRFNEERNSFEYGSMFFDRKLENVVLITDIYEVYAAEDDFCKIVERVHSK